MRKAKGEEKKRKKGGAHRPRQDGALHHLHHWSLGDTEADAWSRRLGCVGTGAVEMTNNRGGSGAPCRAGKQRLGHGAGDGRLAEIRPRIKAPPLALDEIHTS
ncbi:hypothetical protein HRR83_000465 [Exophiala dermatitidis]|uniref:Uncharacterized protein n=1 Tax=Exophiala dermatitidis TaxID=5970 RepID=A0AAN6F4Z7_EXODE|nr:hypothetical protein HRR74_000467 [Exophiala dermatitidis]KAJ4528348.1 hypothetical protein HRR73_000971 [Exophiala dermatitidis]KAJ4531298.1 hypothetical protein HRR76_008964 [Exophiala dermatitidis]KAJ4558461.1 hypothetical protein HRR77_000466 [Exophiala dermatitidis]KAJ4581503.1 hypothetical protein HRR79_000530 [Exophiala dermatitidis]